MLSEKITSSTVIGDPSCQVMSSRSVNSTQERSPGQVTLSQRRQYSVKASSALLTIRLSNRRLTPAAASPLTI